MRDHNIATDAIESPVRRILLVDDDESVVETLEAFFDTDERFEVHTASNGYDAGVLTERVRPHLILLDYCLPDIDGGLVCQRLRENDELRGTRVLIMSGKLSPAEGRRLKKKGADGYVPKPFDLDELRNRVEDLLGLTQTT
jgi:DNA-binding response OmpR family regulator